MRVEEFLKMLGRRPFEPFQIHKSDGSSYAVTHPDQVIVTPRAAHVGLGNDMDGLLAQDVAICELVHVTRLVPLNGEPRKSPRNKQQ